MPKAYSADLVGCFAICLSLEPGLWFLSQSTAHFPEDGGWG